MRIEFPIASPQRRRLAKFLGLAFLCAVAAACAPSAAEAGGTLRVAMTAGDIPVTTGNPDQGFEGYRFVGYNLYDALLVVGFVESRQAVRHSAGARDLL